MTVFDNHTIWVKFYNFADMSSRGKHCFYHYQVDGKNHSMAITPDTFYKKHPKTGKNIYKITFYAGEIFQLTVSFFVHEQGGIHQDKFFDPTYQLLRGHTMEEAEHHIAMMLLSSGEKL